jgi:hypothetical protein
VEAVAHQTQAFHNHSVYIKVVYLI